MVMLSLADGVVRVVFYKTFLRVGMGKKFAIAIVIIVVLVFVYLLSGSGINMLASMARDNWETEDWAPSLLFKAGSIPYWTLRYDMAKEAYGDFLDRLDTEHALSAPASYRKAVCHERLGEDPEAVEEFKYFLLNWPDHSLAESAEKTAKRIAHLKPEEDLF